MQDFPGTSKSPLVSIIITTYNRAHFLPCAIDSVLAQTYPFVEIIVIDDGSTDATAAVIKPYADRIVYVKQSNQGVSAARNLGIQTANGEYLNFLDDDDFFMPTKIERQVHVLESDTEADLVHCGYYHVDTDGKRLDKALLFPTGNILKPLLRRCFLLIHTPLIRRSCIEQVGGFDPSLNCHEDWQFWLRIALAGRQFACVQAPLCAYRLQPGNQSKQLSQVDKQALIVLDNLFASSLPIEIAAMKAEAYALAHAWIGWKYYAAGRYTEGRKNLSAALTLLPRLSIQTHELLDSLRREALSVYVSDAVAFIADVFDHLPPCAADFEQYRTETLAKVQIESALRYYGFNEIEAGRQALTQALKLAPALFEQAEPFADLLLQQALKLPGDDSQYFFNTVFNHLPKPALSLAGFRSGVLDRFKAHANVI